MFEIRPDIVVKLSGQDIDDIMVTALEGGICYWCCEAEVVGGEYLGEYASDQISRGGELRLYDAESEDSWVLTLDKFLDGFKLWLENGGYLEYGADISDIDADAADQIVQFSIFGELVFG